MRLINTIADIETVLISWMEPYQGENQKRKRYVIGKLSKNGDDADLTYFLDTEDFKEAKEKGFRGFESFKITKESHLNVMGLLNYRLPPKKRADFSQFLESIYISPNLKEEISYFSLLGYSGGKLPDDTYSFYNDYTNIKLPIEIYTEVTGLCHRQNWRSLFESMNVGDNVTLELEPDNKFDSNAVKVLFQDNHIGYINRVQSKFYSNWIKQQCLVESFIARKNGTKERPKLFLFVQISNK